jgi:hypothetical protein
MRKECAFVVGAFLVASLTLGAVPAGASTPTDVSMAQPSVTVNAAPTSQVVHIPVTIVRGSNLARFAVQWSTFNPVAGVTPKSGTLRVPRGATTASIAITIPAYTTGGLDQEFSVNFLRSTRTVIVSGQTVVTIHNLMTGPAATHNIAVWASLCVDDPSMSLATWSLPNGGFPIYSYTVTISDAVTGAVVNTWTQPALDNYARLGGLTTYPDPEAVTVAVNAANWTFPPATAIAQPAFCLF